MSASIDKELIYAKLPPQAKELEQAVLGALMLEKNALAEVQDLLKPGKFYLETHQVVYQAILNLDGKSEKVDILTVVEELKRMGALERVGGALAITQLTNAVVSAANILTHARIIEQKHIARECIRLGGEMIHDGYEDSTDPFELLDKVEQGIASIHDSNDRGKITPIATAAAQAMNRMAALRQAGSSMTGIPAGFKRLDAITHGWQDTDLIILAARPSVGKTAFALNLVRNAAMNEIKPVPVAFFSLEMSMGQILERIISRESEVWLDQIKTGQLDDGQMNHIYVKGVRPISQAEIFLDDTPALNIFELRAKCRRLKTKHNIGFIVIDYLQLMSGTLERGNREQEIARISRDLKGLAKELQVPIIALSQLSRAVESRKDSEKIPQLSDLRESGAIEQDADMVMFLYRPEYYGITANEMGESNKGETHVKIAKHRNGSLDTIKLRALLHIQKFVDWEDESMPFPAPGPNFKPVQVWRAPLPFKDNDDI